MGEHTPSSSLPASYTPMEGPAFGQHIFALIIPLFVQSLKYPFALQKNICENTVLS